jgi:RNA polymerase sigma-70 factor (ECF subfamily)
MLLIESRRAARTTGDGGLVLLADQDRSRWDHGLVAEGQDIVRPVPATQPARALPDPGRDQRGAQRRADGGRDGLGADPAAVRPAALDRRRGRWWRSTARSRSPRSRGPGPPSPSWMVLDLHDYYLFHAIRADLLRRLAAAARRRWRTRRRSPTPGTPPSATSWSAGSARSGGQLDHGDEEVRRSAG